MRRFRVLVVMTLLASLGIGLGFTPQSTLAADITVGQNGYTCDYAGLAAAINDAIPIDTIKFDCPSPYTITFTGQIQIAKNVTIDGSNDGNPITLDGNHATRFFYVTAGKLTLQHITLKNGKTDQGALRVYEDGATEITDVIFDSNIATSRGGAIYNEGTVTITQSVFSNNESVDLNVDFDSGYLRGGAIYNTGSLNVSFSTFTANRANFWGSAITNFGDALIYQSTFDGNQGEKSAAALGTVNGNTIVSQCIFVNNLSHYAGGAIAISDNIVIFQSSFINNHADYSGGALEVTQGSAEIYSSTFTGNTALYGSSIFIANLLDPSLKIAWSTIIQPDNASPSLYLQKELTLEGVILGGDGDHCDVALDRIDDSFTLSNDASCNLEGVGSHQNVTNLGLGPLTTATINGVEQSFYPLLSSSPAIDGSRTTACPSADPSENLDQIGNPRPQSTTCDIGAIESPYTGPQTLCANRWNGSLHYATECNRSSTPALFSADGYLDLCVNRWNSATRMSDRCSRSEYHLSVAATQSIPICINRWNSTIRATDRCTRSEHQTWL